MTCPGCGNEPLTRSRYIWKPQALTLTCSHCGAAIRMSPGKLRLSVGLVAGLAVILSVLLILLLRSGVLPRENRSLLVGFVLAVSVVLAYFVRRVLWNKTYVKQADQT